MKTYIKFLTTSYLKSLFNVFIIMLSLVFILNILSETEFLNNTKVSAIVPVYLSLMSAPSIIFEMSFTGLPIVTPKNTNFNLYDDIKLPNQYFFDNNIENKLKNHKSKKLKNIITKEFLHEFEKTN